MRIIECACADTIAEQRLRADDACGRHLATNRDVNLYRQLKASADRIPEPKLRLNTANPLPECATRALFYLHHPLHTDSDPVNATARPPSRQVTT